MHRSEDHVISLAFIWYQTPGHEYYALVQMPRSCLSIEFLSHGDKGGPFVFRFHQNHAISSHRDFS